MYIYSVKGLLLGLNLVYTYKTVLSSTQIKRTTKQCEAQVGWALVGLDVDTKCYFAQTNVKESKCSV